jgi:putative transposase
VIGISPSTFYYKPKVSREEREKQDADLRDKVELVQTEHPKSGYRPMIRYLNRVGVRVGERKIRRIMKKYDLHARIKRAFVRTTDSNHSHRVYPNLLPNRTVMGLDEVWTADFTYIRIGNGFVYLAIILDLYSRRVIGWHV